VEQRGGEDGPTHVGIEDGGADGLLEEAAVDVGEGAEVGIEPGLAALVGGVENLEELHEQWAGVGAVGAGAVADETREGIFLEDAGVVGEEAEHEAGKEELEVASEVVVGFELVVE